MWGEFEARLEENEQERTAPLRSALFDVIRSSALRPGAGVTKKMLAFEFGEGDRLLWEIEHPGRNIFLHAKWQALLAASGFACDARPYKQGVKDGGRHSALSRDWSFGESDCLVVRIDDADQLHRLLWVRMNSCFARWVSFLRNAKA